MYRYIVILDHLGSMGGPCYIQNRALTKRVIKRSRCISFFIFGLAYYHYCVITKEIVVDVGLIILMFVFYDLNLNVPLNNSCRIRLSLNNYEYIIVQALHKDSCPVTSLSDFQ